MMKKIFILFAFLISGIALKAQTHAAIQTPPVRTSDPLTHTNTAATASVVPRKTGGNEKAEMAKVQTAPLKPPDGSKPNTNGAKTESHPLPIAGGGSRPQ